MRNDYNTMQIIGTALLLSEPTRGLNKWEVPENILKVLGNKSYISSHKYYRKIMLSQCFVVSVSKRQRDFTIDLSEQIPRFMLASLILEDWANDKDTEILGTDKERLLQMARTLRETNQAMASAHELPDRFVNRYGEEFPIKTSNEKITPNDLAINFVSFTVIENGREDKKITKKSIIRGMLKDIRDAAKDYVKNKAVKDLRQQNEYRSKSPHISIETIPEEDVFSIYLQWGKIKTVKIEKLLINVVNFWNEYPKEIKSIEEINELESIPAQYQKDYRRIKVDLYPFFKDLASYLDNPGARIGNNKIENAFRDFSLLTNVDIEGCINHPNITQLTHYMDILDKLAVCIEQKKADKQKGLEI